MTLRGGAPLMAGAEVVGAVGIASLDKDNDVRIAQAPALGASLVTAARS
jgi:glc operon protein GlcG